MRLTLLTLLPSTLALAVPEARTSSPYHTPPHALFPHSTMTKTITVTTTITITMTIPGTFPTANATFPNATTTMSSVDLAPITLITLPVSETQAVTGEETSGLAPITLITLPTETDAVATGTGAETVDEGAAPTPNDIAPITLIDVGVATPI